MFLSGRKREKEDWVELDEIVLNFQQKELDQVIKFLQNVREQAAECREAEEHWHYRDESDLWSEGQPDLIVFVEPDLEANMK